MTSEASEWPGPLRQGPLVWNLSFDAATGVLQLRITGVITGERVQQLLDDTVEALRRHETRRLLVDNRSASLELSSEQMLGAGKQAEPVLKELTDKIAIVFREVGANERLVRSILSLYHVRTGIFDRFDQATAWLTGHTQAMEGAGN